MGVKYTDLAEELVSNIKEAEESRKSKNERA